MCGINGFMMLGSHLPNEASEYLLRMNRAIAHRGPDDQGTYINTEKGLALGHLRLSIIDLSAAGHQPMFDEYGNCIVFNGEIYNYHELKKEFGSEKFLSNSDTEVLLKSYQKNGHSTLNNLNGMFAFAYFDSKNNVLKLARDRAGKKPLYYSTMGGVFSFSSEIKALLELPWIKKELDEEALYHFLTFNHVDSPATFFKNIKKLGAGEYLTVSSKGIVEHENYYNINYNFLGNQSESEITSTLFNKLEQAVDLRMVADVPVGAFLSGGVDSSAVVALMRAKSAGTIKTFSVGFEGQPDYDERIYAQKIAKLFNTEHHEKIVGKKDIEEFLPSVVSIFDEPMADATCIPVYFISELARKHNTIVVQTGDGADELLAGYNSWQKYEKIYPYYNILNSLPKSILKLSSSLIGYDDNKTGLREIIYRASKNQQLFWGGAKAFKESTKRQILSSQFLEKNSEFDSYSVIEKHLKEFQKVRAKHKWLTDKDWMCYLGYKYLIPAKYLYRMDRIGMAHSIEIRNPFLDYEFVDYALSVPYSLKSKNHIPKYVLKKSLEQTLPHDILYRKKMGFCVPLKEWSQDIIIRNIEDELTSFCKNADFFSEAGLRNQINAMKQGSKDYTNNLWTIYFIMQWFKKWM
jgi:asparagine synthase (glutamine-hydrolysing)